MKLEKVLIENFRGIERMERRRRREMAEIWLVCEGQSDTKILASVFTRVLPAATRLTVKAQEAAASPHLSAPAVSQRYDMELTRISATSYLADLRFLEEFDGKDLLREFLGRLQQERKAQLKASRLLEELEMAVPQVYATNPALYGTDDFRDLANGVRALAGLPALT